VKLQTPFPFLLAVATLSVSCGGDFSPEGTYKGKIVMEDGRNSVTLELRPDNTAQVRGLLPKTVQGTWVKEATGLGFSKDGVVATFDDERSNQKYRVVLMLQQAEEGLTLADIRVRLLMEGKYSMLQSFQLKEAKPLLRRVN